MKLGSFGGRGFISYLNVDGFSRFTDKSLLTLFPVRAINRVSYLCKP